MDTLCFEFPYNLALAFEKITKLYPNKTAIQFTDGESVTYHQLNVKANQIGNWFKKIGVKDQEVIAIFNNKTLNDFASMLACLKIGAIYTNIDPHNPKDRLLKILTICKPKLVLFHSNLISPIKDRDNETIWVNYSNDFLKECDLEDHPLQETLQIHGNKAAYIMFTSGSTGFPKGAVISHNNVLRFIEWSKHRFSIMPHDVLANVNPLYFDNSVFDMYTALFCGATLLPIPASILKKPREVLNLINEFACTIWFSVPSLLIYFLNLKILNRDDFYHIRQIIFGGEVFPKSKLKELMNCLSREITFTNVYGPTECTCISSSYEVVNDDLAEVNGILPLGKINPNFDFLILDEFGKKVANGSVGELCLLGSCVGKGYYDNSTLTAQSFKQNPYSPHLPEFMYCTGDLVYQDSNTSSLHFVARLDNQIKHQGYRIQLEEIESALYCLKYINEAAVIFTKEDASFGKLIAIVVMNHQKTEFDVICDLRQLLPQYMIPKKILFKTHLPKNQNGKIDRMQLLSECKC